MENTDQSVTQQVGWNGVRANSLSPLEDIIFFQLFSRQAFYIAKRLTQVKLNEGNFSIRIWGGHIEPNIRNPHTAGLRGTGK